MTYLFEEFELDEENFCLSRDGQRVPLEPKSLRVLLLLAGSQGKLVEKNTILEAVWTKTFVEDTTLTRAIALIRKQLGDDPRNPRFIETVPTLGYRFVAPVRLAALPDKSTAPAEIRPAVMPPDSLAPSDMKEHRAMMPGTRQAKLYILVAIASLVAFAVVALYRFAAPRPAVLAGRGTIVLADFTNLTGDPVFDDTLRQGMTVQLEQSPLLTLVAEEQIRQTLVLMGQSADARLTADLGRDLCQRAGAAAVLDGSIAHLGDQYVLGLRARDCYTGALLDAEQVQAARKEEVLNALSQIASRFRGRIGESLASLKARDTPLAEATTPSLDALKAYSTGLKLLSSQGSGAALPVFKSATEIDPQFAMAHAHLGRMYGDLGEEDLAAASIQRAYDLRQRSSEKERYFIDASYQIQVSGNMAKARETCEAWERLYPRDVAPYGFLSGFIYPVFERHEDAISEANKAIEADPDFFIGYNNVAAGAIALERIGEAEEALDRAGKRKLDMSLFAYQRYQIAFLKNDQQGMRRASDAMGEADWALDEKASMLAWSGRFSDSRQLSQRARDLALQSPRKATAAYIEGRAGLREAFIGNLAQASRHAKASLVLSRARNVEYLDAFVLGLANDSAQANELADDLAKRFPEDTMVQFNYVPTLRALVALSRHNPEQAVELLKPVAPYELGAMLDAVYVHGLVLLSARRGPEAAVEFQKILDHRGIVLYDTLARAAQLQLARSFAIANDGPRAAKAYAVFVTMWQGADADIPILKQAISEGKQFKLLPGNHLAGT